MFILNQVACSDDYTPRATLPFLYHSNGGYASIRDQPVFCSLAWGVQGSEQWTTEFRAEPGNLQFAPNIIGVRFRNAVAGQVATVTAVLSSHDEPSVFLTAAGVSGTGGGGITLVTSVDGSVVVTNPAGPTVDVGVNPAIIPLPATTVVSETTFGQAPAVGTGVRYARNDHTHGTPPAPLRKILVCWAGPVPATTGDGLVWRVPFNSDGSSFTFTLARSFARIETTSVTVVSFVIQKSSGGGAFTPTNISTLSISAGTFDTVDNAVATSVSSGDLLRLSFLAVGTFSTAPVYFDVELIGSE